MTFPFGRSALVAALLVALTVPAAAQGRPRGAEAGFDLAFFGAFTGSGAVDRGRGLGDADVSTDQWQLEAAFRQPLGEGRAVEIGASLQVMSIDTHGAAIPLPDTLRGTALRLGGSWELNDRWALIAQLRPGFYDDGEAGGSDAFSLPALLLARWAASPELTWFFGTRVSPDAEHPVLPVAGVRWRFRPEWTLLVAYPRTEVLYSYNRDTTFSAGVLIDSTTFAVDQTGSAVPAGVSLGETWLDYQAIRPNLSVRRHLGNGVYLRVEGGMAFARRFDYFDRDFAVKVDDAPYGAITLTASY